MTPKGTGDTNDRLFQRALIVHAVGIALLVWCNYMGWLTKVITTDTLYISRTIIALGIFVLLVGTAKLWGFTRELNVAKEAKNAVAQGGKKALFSFLSRRKSRTSEFVQLLSDAGPANRSYVTRSFAMKLERKAGSLDHFLEILPMLGLFGTVAGIISSFGALNISDLTQSAPQAVPGFMIALITTAVGIVFTIWFIFIRRLIGDGVGQLTEILLAFDLDGGKHE